MQSVALALVLLVASLLLLVVSCLRRVPPGHAAVLVDDDRCRMLPSVGGWALGAPGGRRFARVDLGHTNVVYPASWHELPGVGRLRLGLTVGLTVANPCVAASHGLLGVREGAGRGAGPVLAIDTDAVVRRLHTFIPSLLTDLLPILGLDAHAPRESSGAWRRVRHELVLALAPVGLVVQHLTLNDLTVEQPRKRPSSTDPSAVQRPPNASG